MELVALEFSFPWKGGNDFAGETVGLVLNMLKNSLGQGQRELIIGDRQMAIAVDSVLYQAATFKKKTVSSVRASLKGFESLTRHPPTGLVWFFIEN